MAQPGTTRQANINSFIMVVHYGPARCLPQDKLISFTMAQVTPSQMFSGLGLKVLYDKSGPASLVTLCN